MTVSDTRTPENDDSGNLIRQLVEAAGHAVASHSIVRDEPDEVNAALDAAVEGPAQIAIFNGGTGISRRDRTFDVLTRRLEKELPGFGELFRMLELPRGRCGGHAEPRHRRHGGRNGGRQPAGVA